MKKIILIAILMATVTFVQGQRRYGSFNIGGMNPVELSEQISQQISDLQKDLKALDKDLQVLNFKSQKNADLVTNNMLNENLARRDFLISQIEKLIEQKNELLVSNAPVTNISVNTKDPMAMANAYYMVRVADAFVSGEQTNSQRGFKGILVNYWNYLVQVTVTGPGGFVREFSLEAGSSKNPSIQEFDFQMPGNYTATFRSSTIQAKSTTKPGGMPNIAYYHDGRQYAFKATQLGRF
ncbi:MAG: hypothetical protein PHE20_03380 [Patescibacteria group bacterium]|nr:hypothetical protein [Patescibacteria group bacterium]